MLTHLLAMCSTPDIAEHGFIVPVPTGTVAELGPWAAGLGFDGLEFMPNPEQIPDATATAKAMAASGIPILVVNTGRVQAQGYALLHRDPEHRERSIQLFESLVDFAGEIGASVGLGMARGFGDTTLQEAELTTVMPDVFGRIADRAATRGTAVMLEPADAGVVAAVGNMAEAVRVARQINSPGFVVMLDSLELHFVETSITAGVEASNGLAHHIQLYDPGYRTPGVLPAHEQLDWDELARALDSVGFVGTGAMLLDPRVPMKAPAEFSIDFLRQRLAATPSR